MSLVVSEAEKNKGFYQTVLSFQENIQDFKGFFKLS